MFAGQRLHESVIRASFRGMRGRERRCPCRSGEKRTTAGTTSHDWRCAPGTEEAVVSASELLAKTIFDISFLLQARKKPGFPEE